jgi:tetratricopeptide (TPR) repeat protein
MKRLAILASLLMSACANPINLHTANEYFLGGKDNAEQGKWFNARMSFGRAWANANWGNADDKVTAVYAYEYGRSSGVICDWAESEKGLLKALELDRKVNGPVHMDLDELAFMYHAKGEIQKSAEYFSQGKTLLDKLDADKRDPIGYANILSEYADVLDQLGNHAEAGGMRAKAAEVRKSSILKASGHAKTPYGEHCDQKSLAMSIWGFSLSSPLT